jgi:hypothetical protein
MATKRRVRPTGPQIKPPGAADLAAARELGEALLQVSELPEADRWSMALALLPDEHLLALVKTEDGEASLNRSGTLAVAAIHGLYGIDPGDQIEDLDYTQVLTMAVHTILVSYVAELEKRQLHFCREVIHMEGPLQFDPEQPVKLIPKGTEEVTIAMLLDYYGAPKHPVLTASDT